MIYPNSTYHTTDVEIAVFKLRIDLQELGDESGKMGRGERKEKKYRSGLSISLSFINSIFIHIR